MLASKRFVRPSCYPWNKTKIVGAYRIRPSRRRKSMFDDGDVFAINMSNHPVQSSCHPWNDRTGVGAYRIRPHGGEKARSSMVTCSLPLFRFRPHEGVCDTPLHLFDGNHGFLGWIHHFVFAHSGRCFLSIHGCPIYNEMGHWITQYPIP